MVKNRFKIDSLSEALQFKKVAIAFNKINLRKKQMKDNKALMLNGKNAQDNLSVKELEKRELILISEFLASTEKRMDT